MPLGCTDTMADSTPQNEVSASLVAIEANIVIAGIEAVTAIWVVGRLHVGQSIFPSFPDTWNWSFSLYAVLGFLGIVVAGFGLEAIAGLLERAISRPLFFGKKEELRDWYRNCVEAPERQATVLAQKWIWKSAQAQQEFTRRRLRILVSRNTSVVLLLLTLSWLCLIGWSFWLFLGLFGSVAFAWLWLDAQVGWNRAAKMAEELGEP